MLVSEYIISFLEKKGIKYIFGYQGGSVTHLIDAIGKNPNITYIQNYHEQASALCANAYAMTADEGIGVALASNGPGVTNLITGIANAYCDSIPVIFFTGQVHTFSMRKKQNIRQESFQEIQIMEMVENITKYHTVILNPDDIAYELEKSFNIAVSGRKGPVLIDLPVDIQGMRVNISNLRHFKQEEISYEIGDNEVEAIIERFQMAKRPIILAGGGTALSNSREELRNLLSVLRVPVVVTLMGMDSVKHTSELFFGFIGMYGNRCANLALQNSDLILVLGSRLDSRQTGKQTEKFGKHAYIIHVDIDKAELGHKVNTDLNICGDLTILFKNLTCRLREKNWNYEYKEWIELLKIWHIRYQNESRHENDLNPNYLIEKIGDLLIEDSAITCDVGQNQLWVAQSLRVRCKHFRILNSGGLGTMGFSLPAAIGAYYSAKYTNICCFTGDGGIQMNIQELCLIGNKKIPIKIMLMNNHALGLIRDIHKKYYDEHYIGSVEGFNQPNFQLIAKAYGLEYLEITCTNDISKLKNIFSDDKPYLINCIISEEAVVYPELMGKDSLDNQIPYLSSEDKYVIESELRKLVY